jgi:hypothetical protein
MNLFDFLAENEQTELFGKNVKSFFFQQYYSSFNWMFDIYTEKSGCCKFTDVCLRANYTENRWSVQAYICLYKGEGVDKFFEYLDPLFSVRENKWCLFFGSDVCLSLVFLF